MDIRLEHRAGAQEEEEESSLHSEVPYRVGEARGRTEAQSAKKRPCEENSQEIAEQLGTGARASTLTSPPRRHQRWPSSKPMARAAFMRSRRLKALQPGKTTSGRYAAGWGRAAASNGATTPRPWPRVPNTHRRWQKPAAPRVRCKRAGPGTADRPCPRGEGQGMAGRSE